MTIPSQNLHVMGIVNVTPDSFSDGGQYSRLDQALRHAERLLLEGATILDIGGESTRPNALAVTEAEEIRRVIPLLKAVKLRFPSAMLSVDTQKPNVMRAALDIGVDMINDVMALQAPEALAVCASGEVSVCLMHMQGQPRTMQHNPHYQDVLTEVSEFLHHRAQLCETSGIKREHIWLDPGFGFGKTLEHNLTLLRHLEHISALNYPILVGLSRKSMIGALLNDRPVDGRLQGSVAAALIAAQKGARIIRVHDVQATVDALKILTAVLT